MQVQRLFNPLKIILDTPEEVSALEYFLRKYALSTEDKMFGWINPSKPPSGRQEKEHHFLLSLLRACEQTSKQKDFKE